MPRVLPLLLLLGMLLAGCASGDPPAPGPLDAGPAAHIKVRFGGLVDTIEIGAVERLPLREAVLVAPGGASTPAGTIVVDPMPRIATGQWAASHRWNDAVSQDNALVGLVSRNTQAGAALRGQQQLLAMVSRAEITLPDPVAYRRDWEQYRVRLSFGTPPGEVETVEIAAPAPPPR